VPELDESDVMDNHPNIFRDKDKSPKETLICFGIAVGEGWLPIINELCHEIKTVTDSLIATQIKEKFGGLRFYYTFDENDDLSSIDYEKINLLVRKYEIVAENTCESCGNATNLSKSGHWYKTICPDCHDGEYEDVSSESEDSTTKTWFDTHRETNQYVNKRLQASNQTQQNSPSFQDHSDFRPYLETLFNKIYDVEWFLRKSWAWPFKKLKNKCNSMKFKNRNTIPTNRSQMDWWEWSWDNVVKPLSFLAHTCNPFKKIRTRWKYEVVSYFESSRDSDKYELGDLKQIDVTREVQLFGKKIKSLSD
jgi:hypothetical protein